MIQGNPMWYRPAVHGGRWQSNPTLGGTEGGALQVVTGGLYGVASLAIGMALAYHGWKRTQSVGWTIGWWFSGIVWPLSLTLAVAQGFGKPETE